MEWEVSVEQRLARIETSIEEMREDVRTMNAALMGLLEAKQADREYRRRSEALERRLHTIENERIAVINRRLDRIYGGLSVLAFLVTILASFVAALLL